MANIRYTLFGEEFIESQGKMMIRIFERLLSDHPDRIPEALEQFGCLAEADYSQDLQGLRAVSSAYLNKKTLKIAGRNLCVGTSYNMKQKQNFISRLFLLCEEDMNQFQIKEMDAKLPSDKGNTPVSDFKARVAARGVRYKLFGMEYKSSQSQMMYHTFWEIFQKAPNLVDWAVDHLHCASWTDYTSDENRNQGMPSQFNSSQILEVEGRRICIGSGYNLKAKLNLIDRLLKQAGLSAESFTVYPPGGPHFNLSDWHGEAIEAVLRAMGHSDWDRRLGVISMPAGTGKTIMLAALFFRIFQHSEKDYSILLLTGRKDLAIYYRKALQDFSEGFYPVEIAETKKDLQEKMAAPGRILVSTAQKLLRDHQRTSVSYGPKEKREVVLKEDITPITESSRLLVVVDEVSYNYYSRTYHDMHAQLPNAAFLGLTIQWKISKRMMASFGPPLYQYSYDQAYQDGLVRGIDYHFIKPVNHLPGQKGVLPGDAKSRAFSYVDIIENIKKNVPAIRKWMEELDKNGSALLLCNSLMEVEEYYRLLREMNYDRKREIYVKLSSKDGFNPSNTGLPDSARWDGQRFHGILIACYPPAGMIQPLDLLFLDRLLSPDHLFASILSPLIRRGSDKYENGIVIDFQNEPETVKKLLPDNFPIRIYENPSFSAANPSGDQKSPDPEIQELCALLSQYHYTDAREVLASLTRAFPERGEAFSGELSFLFDTSLTQEKQRRCWRQHRTEMEWKTNLWCCLSKNSTIALRIPEKPEPDEPDFDELDFNEPEFHPKNDIENTGEIPPTQPSGGTSQERGTQLEIAAMQLFRGLFELDEEESGEVLEQLRRQRSGLQYGFDVTFTYRDRFGMPVTCRVECKNYQDSLIRTDEVTNKLASAQHTGREIDHWILISPNGQVSNELAEMQDQWQEKFRWEPIWDIQFWTMDENVRELFGLFPDLYTQFYGAWENSPMKEWDKEKREQVVRFWKAKLAPVLKFPKKWRDYLRQPARMLMSCESDPYTSSKYEELYGNHVPMRLLDENEAPVDGTGEDYFLRWLHTPESDCALLLGDFGDGKTFFTYTLARRMAKGFLESPSTRWIPLRLSLNDLRDNPMDCRDFLERRLREFGGSIEEWNEIHRRYRCFVILDGLDEMSLGMDDRAVLGNLVRLQEVMEQFRGHKLLVTSRKMAVYADKVRERILYCLNNPDILHLAPISRRSCLDFLKRLADSPQKKERLMKLQNTHDLLGLAAKPLFLEMMQVLLDSDTVEETDAAGIYEQYTKNVLKRKFDTQLRAAHDYTHPQMITKKMTDLLEELALCLQIKGTDSISLDEFKQHIRQDNLADMLWETIDGEDLAADAEGRIANRSLLKYEGKSPSHTFGGMGVPRKVRFCHRSMKEYFIAQGLVKRLSSDPEVGKRLLMECEFGYEILEFAGMAISKQKAGSAQKMERLLCAFARETRGKAGSPFRDQYERLGANSVNLLHYAGLSLQGEDWSGLLLDQGVLSGMDLAGKNFSGSSMRYAHLDNADLSNCDLRGCDFTGVQFEKSGQLTAFAVDPQDGALIAAYKDGKIRRWGIGVDSTKLLTASNQGSGRHIFLLPDGCEGMVLSGVLRFWRRTAASLEMRGFVPMEDRVRILDLGKTNALVWQRGTACLVNLSEGKILLQREAPEDMQACFYTDLIFLIFKKNQGIELWDFSAGELNVSPLLDDQTIMAFHACSMAGGDGVLVSGDQNGSVKSYLITQNQENRCWELKADGKSTGRNERVLSVDTDGAGGIYASFLSGIITRYRKNQQGDLTEDKEYRLELKCRGAKIEGVHPKEQYEVLRQAVNENQET